MIKNYISFDIPYWIGKKLNICIYYYIPHSYYKELRITIWNYKRLKDIPGHENEWGTNWWKIITLWKR